MRKWISTLFCCLGLMSLVACVSQPMPQPVATSTPKSTAYKYKPVAKKRAVAKKPAMRKKKPMQARRISSKRVPSMAVASPPSPILVPLEPGGGGSDGPGGGGWN